MMKTQIWAHRGASRAATENTMAAFKKAEEMGADGVELDVMLCATGEVVVCHDETLERLANDARAVRSLPWEILKDITLSGGGAVPLLAQVLDELSPSMTVNVELKVFSALEVVPLCQAVSRVLRHRRNTREIFVSSFHPLALGWFRLVCPEIPLGVLFHKDQKWPAAKGAYGPLVAAKAVHPQACLITASSIGRWESQRLRVHAWTVDEPEEAKRLMRLGVAALITNEPDVLAFALSDDPIQAPKRVAVENEKIVENSVSNPKDEIGKTQAPKKNEKAPKKTVPKKGEKAPKKAAVKKSGKAPKKTAVKKSEKTPKKGEKTPKKAVAHKSTKNKKSKKDL